MTWGSKGAILMDAVQCKHKDPAHGGSGQVCRSCLICAPLGIDVIVGGCKWLFGVVG